MNAINIIFSRKLNLKSVLNIVNFTFVQVYCRIRPLDNPNADVCIKPLNTTVVQLVPPEVGIQWTLGNLAVKCTPL